MAVKQAMIAARLRAAVSDLRVRGLKKATQFAAELLIDIGEAATSHQSSQKSWKDDNCMDESEDWPVADRYEAAKAYFDTGEYLRAHQLLLTSNGRGMSKY